MEENGLSTVVLTPMPEFHRAVGIPRSVAIAYPFGRLFGEVGNAAGQLEILTQTLTMLDEADAPGQIKHLANRWPETPKDAKWHPPEISPIIKANLETIKKLTP